MHHSIFTNLALGLLLIFLSCSPPKAGHQVSWVLTKADSSVLFQDQTPISLQPYSNSSDLIQLDTTFLRQEIEGFGFTLTEASAYLIQQLPSDKKSDLLNELFAPDGPGIHISFLRIGIGATDLSREVYSYADSPEDTSLTYFNFSTDSVYLIPLIKEILQIHPGLKIMATPWSAPAWMKDNKKTMGGHLAKKYYPLYAEYLLTYIRNMHLSGIPIYALTPQNEPLHGGNNPSMEMAAEEQSDFIKNHLGPVFKKSGISTKLIIYDHNADHPEYPLSILADSAANVYIDGTAFHLYNGDISVLSGIHDRFPDKSLYFTEQWTGAKGLFGGDLIWHIKNIIIGSMRNWSQIALEWNLANDPAYAMHTPGGCTECKGALTISGNDIKKNVSYYIIAHISKFVPAGSRVLFTPSDSSLLHIAFITPSHRKVLLVCNESDAEIKANAGDVSGKISFTMPPKSVASFIWP